MRAAGMGVIVRRRWRAVYLAASHFSMVAWPAVMLTIVARDVADFDSVWVDVDLLLLTIVTAVLSFCHIDLDDCPRCRAAVPGDGDLQAARKRQTLHTAHMMMRRDFLLFWGGYAIAVNVAAVFLIPSSYAKGITVDIAAIGPALIFYWMVTRHRKLKQWCPWCREDDGGEDPDGPPDPNHGNTLYLPAAWCKTSQ